MLPLNLDDATAEHIGALIADEAEESLILEFKAVLPGSSTDERRELLYDIAAMANASGGDLIYGIDDRREENQAKGIADKISGLRITNGQSEVARIENLIRDSIAPRLSGIRVRVVSSEDGDVLVIRVPRSWSGPHMVTFHSVNKFFSRTTTGKFPMDVYQIGQAFAQQRLLGERIEDWRSQRIETLLLNHGPARLAGPSILVIHLIPASALFQPTLAANWNVPQDQKYKIKIINGNIADFRYNAQGFLATSHSNELGVGGYTQLHRNGAFEYVDTTIVNGDQLQNGTPVIASLMLEQAMVDVLENAWSLMPSLGISPPVYMAVSLLDVMGSIMPHGARWQISPRQFADRVVTTPHIQVETLNEQRPYPTYLLPLVNSIWQASGAERTPYLRNDVWEPFSPNWRF